MSTASLTFDKKELYSQQHIWSFVQEQLKKECGEATYRSWLSKLEFVSAENGLLVLTAPTKFMREWIVTHYHDMLMRLWKIHDVSILRLDIVIAANNNDVINYNQQAAKNNLPSFIKASTNNSNDYNLTQLLDARFTFDNFVVGKPNELAYVASRSVAESNKVNPTSNPLFLYGGVGLGKTHLMHAIAWHIHQNNESRRVIYMSAEKFMYQFISALRNKDTMSFKEYFRNVDVLMIDDVQFICGKDSTQEEFFHTLNDLIDNNRQIVISADRSPSDLDGMEERIKSRLGWGLVADVHSTTYELRLGILQSKLDHIKSDVPKNVVEFLAAKITSNVRELEGALNKVIAHSRLVGGSITLDNTQNILRDLLRSNEKTITIGDIQKKVCEYYNIRISDITSSRRSRSVARPRQIAMFLSKSLTTQSLVEIGKKFGGKDHTTVMHAIRTIETLSSSKNDISEDIRLLTRTLDA